jgi:hypothetical protein
MGGNSGRMRAGRRRQKRSKMVLGVRVFVAGPDGKFTEELVHTLDLTPDGARVGGLRRPPCVGEKVTVQRKAQKRAFRVVWVVQTGREFQLGLEAVETLRDHWQLELPQAPDEYTLTATATAAGK